MANYDALKAAMAAVIKPNGQGRITGAKHQAVLRDVIDTLGALYQFGGVAHPSDTYDKADIRAAYLASEAGTYEAFGGLELDGSALMVLRYDGEWHAEAIGIAAGPALVTWAELKALRDAGALEAGAVYRITDYTTTTAQANTRSAGHLFDIVVVALDNATLSEDALAVAHEGEDYFAGCKLEAWNLKYCLDNDTNRFGWADADNGKGVIWWMRDEWGNECPYDFKNIQFKGVDMYEQEIYRYTFNYDRENAAGTAVEEVWDTTIKGNDGTMVDSYSRSVIGVFGNVIKPYHKVIIPPGTHTVQTLNNIVFTSSDHYTPDYNGCHDNVFSSNCHDIAVSPFSGFNCITFGNGCYNIQMWGNNTTFGNDCHDISFGGENCTFGNGCNNCAFGNSPYSTGGQLVRSTIGAGVEFVLLPGGGYYNVTILAGVKGTQQMPILLSLASTAQYQQIVCLDSNGQLQIKVLGDL